MNREDIIRMAREAKIWLQDLHYGYEKIDEHLVDGLERFAALVEAHVNAKEKERQRYDVHSCGPDCDRYICVAVRNEREGCEKAASVALLGADKALADRVLRAIRARNNT